MRAKADGEPRSPTRSRQPCPSTRRGGATVPSVRPGGAEQTAGDARVPGTSTQFRWIDKKAAAYFARWFPPSGSALASIGQRADSMRFSPNPGRDLRVSRRLADRLTGTVLDFVGSATVTFVSILRRQESQLCFLSVDSPHVRHCNVFSLPGDLELSECRGGDSLAGSRLLSVI